MKRVAAKLFHLFIAFCILSCYAPSALPQGQTTGAIQGMVFEAGGRQPISGAVITVTNEDTGLERTTITGADGSYTINTLPPGFYTIKVSAANYQPDSITRFPVRLSKVNTITPPPFALSRAGAAPQQPQQPQPQQPTPAPGAPVEESQVEQLVNTVNATRSENFDSRQLVALPLPATRTFDDLAFLAPGVAPPPETIGVTVGPGIGPGVGTAGHFSINGLRSRSINFTIDGSDNNDPDVGTRRQGFVTLIPQSIESIQEFQVATLLWDAEFGRNLGGQVNAVTKAGGNSFRGQAHLFFTHDDLNARNFFDFTGGPSKDENPLTRTQAGFVIGGPIVENRTQFFGSYEFLNIRAGIEQHFATPAQNERSFLGGNRLFAPLQIGNTLNILTFPGATPLGVNIFSFYPLPNNPVGPFGRNTYSEELPADGRGSIASFRVMQQLTPNNTLNARYNFTDDERVLSSVNQALSSTIETDSRTQNLSLILDSAVSATLFNQARFSYGRTRLDFPEYIGNPLVFPDRMLQTPILFNGIPAVANSSTGGAIGQIIIQPFSPVGIDVFAFAQSRVNNTFQVADTVSWTRGTHSFKFGGDVRRFQLNSLQERNYRPQVVFGIGTFATGQIVGDQVQFSPTLFLSRGADLASVGVPSSIFQSITSGVPDSTIGLRFTEYNFFFNDNWQIRSNLTMDYGLRYEYNTVPREENNRIENALALNNLPTPGNSQFDTAARTAAFNAAVNAYRQILDGRTEIYDKDGNNFGPHLGLAWDPFGNGKTSIRAGYGIYYDTILGAVVSQSRNVFPNEIPFNIDPTFAGFSLFRLTNPAVLILDGNENARLIRQGTVNQFGLGPQDFVAGIGQLFLQNRAAGLAFTLPAKDLPTPYAQHWHLTIERELLRNYLVSAAYVGTKGTKLTRLITPNLGPNVIPNAIFVDALTANPILLGGNSFFQDRPNPNLGAFQIFENAASSNYHSLQLEARKRYSSGYTFTAAYTWSHAIDEVSDVFPLAGAPVLPQDSSNPGLERGNANFDIRHRFTTSVIWDLPFYRGQTGGAASALGGWQVAGIFQYHSGQPFTLNVPFDANLDGNLSDRPSTTNGLVFLDEHGPQRVRLPAGQTFLNFVNVTGFFNPFTLQPVLFPGTGFVGRNTVRADNFINLDMALSKDFRFTETQSLLFRTEVFNIFNRANFGIPIRVIGAPGFGSSVNTVNPARVIQFALKYNF